MNEIPAALIEAARNELHEWRREAAGSRQQQATYQRTADEHRDDAVRAESRVLELVAALKAVGVEA